jgi:branched-subunit amino acid aminotransferase/4-amino-4-deoxychorismate lyase
MHAAAVPFIEGIKVMVPSHRRTPLESLTPRAKTHNYLNLIVANQEIHAVDPSAWAILLDANGNLCEGLGSNIFVVRHGEIFTPREKYVLPGVSRQTAIDLAHEAALVRTAWKQHSRWQIGRTTELTSAHENGRTLQGPAL